MKCPICKSNTKTLESRHHERGTRRRKQCEKCHHRWKTYEVSENMLDFYESQLKRIKELELTINKLTTGGVGKGYHGNGPIWTESEEKMLIAFYFDNLPYKNIAQKMGRSYNAIEQRVIKLRKSGAI